MAYTRRFIEPPGAPRLAYAQEGAGPDVVLLHGALSVLDDVAAALLPPLATDRRVTAFDRPGHGESGRLGLTGSPWAQAQAIRAAVQALGLERPVIVGHSFGGAVALAYSLQFAEEITGAVALAPIAFPELRPEHLIFGPRAAPGVGPLVNSVLSGAVDPILLPILWRAMFLPQAMPEQFAAEFPFALAGRAAQSEAEGEDTALLLPGLLRSSLGYRACRARVRIFAGSRDLVVNSWLHGRLAARLLPKGEFSALPGLGHMIHHFAQTPIVGAIRDLGAASVN